MANDDGIGQERDGHKHGGSSDGPSGSPSLLRKPLKKVGRISAKYPTTIIFLTLLIVASAGGLAATNVKANIGMELYLEDSSETKQDFNRLNGEYDRGNQVFVMVEDKSVTDPETIRTIDALSAEYSTHDEFTRVRSLADVVKAGNGGTIPETEDGVKQAIQRVRTQSNSSAVLVDNLHPKEGMATIIISYGNVNVPDGAADMYGFMPKQEGDIVTETVQDDTADVSVPDEMEVTVTGQPVYQRAVFGQVFTEIMVLLTVGFTMVFFVVYMVMRGRLQRNWTSILAIVSTFAAMVIMNGAMGLFKYQFNSVMLAILPISLGLGVDYGLQIMTRFVEERDRGLSIVDAAGKATATTGHTLLLAMLTTSIGLGSLLVSSVPPTRQFGVMAAVSVMSAMVLSVTFLVAMLSYLDVRPSSSTASDGKGLPERSAGMLARGLMNSPVLVALVVILIVGAGAAAYPNVDTKEDMQEYWPQDVDARENIEQLQSVVETPDRMSVIVDTKDAYTPSTLRNAETAQDRIQQIDKVEAITSPASAVSSANDGTIPDNEDRIEAILEQQTENDLFLIEDPKKNSDSILLTVYLSDVKGKETMETRGEIKQVLQTQMSATEVTVTGTPVLNRVIVNKVTSGRTKMTALSFTFGLLFLVLVFRSLKPATLIVGTVPAAAALIVAGGMYLFEIPWNPGTVMMSSIVLGIGLDYGLHIYERLQEQLAEGRITYRDSLERTLEKLSRPIIGSGLTTMVGFGVQMISDFPIVANFGKTLFISMFAVLFASLVILPVALVLIGPGKQTIDERDRPASMPAK